MNRKDNIARGIRVLVGCESSGETRNAFLARGFDAWSCDLLPSDDKTSRHIQDDVRKVIKNRGPWDLAIMHPPCTRLCNSGVCWLHRPPKGKTLDQMWQDLDEGAELFSDCWNSDVPRVCVENPIMHKYARERIENYQKPQIVQPWWFGDEAFKATGLHLRGLPDLVPTNRLKPPAKGTEAHTRWSALHRTSPGPNRWKIRSKTFPGVAAAFAQQFGDVLLAEIRRTL